jgi:hypothetical protein
MDLMKEQGGQYSRVSFGKRHMKIDAGSMKQIMRAAST